VAWRLCANCTAYRPTAPAPPWTKVRSQAQASRDPSSVSTQSPSAVAQNTTRATAVSTNQQAVAFVSADKSVQIQGDICWAPLYPRPPGLSFQSNEYGLIPSLFLKGGGRGSLDVVVSQDQLPFPNQDKSFFTYYPGGVRLAFVK
jgi:hypothetical protein